MEGDIVKATVLAEFKCDDCGKLCLRMTNAPVKHGLIQNPAERPPFVRCNACERKERDAEVAAADESRERRLWLRKNEIHRIRPLPKGRA